jgi:hypothetical protein
MSYVQSALTIDTSCHRQFFVALPLKKKEKRPLNYEWASLLCIGAEHTSADDVQLFLRTKISVLPSLLDYR